MAKRTMTPEQATASRQRRAEHLEAAVRALLGSEGWARWVRVRSRNGLARYSWFNQVQIAAQRPDATYVCGRGDWRKLGYELAAEEWRHPIWILAPFTGKRTETVIDDDGRDSELERRYRYFRAVKVYDRAQVHPIDGADPVALCPPGQPLTGDSHAYVLAPLVALARSLGYRVCQRPLGAEGVQGWCDRQRREIVVNRDRSANARVRILVHELAHAHPAGQLDYEHFGREHAEVLVDTVTYIVCGQVGLDVADESIPYVASWGEAGALQAIHAFAERVDAVARAIEEAIRNASGLDTDAQPEGPRLVPVSAGPARA
jgi:N-terminal domain of anti-restriction factor ArdC